MDEKTGMAWTVVELCAGGGGQMIGLHRAGFECLAAVELDPHACDTLRASGIPSRVIEDDLRAVGGREFSGVDLLAGGVPCPPFSKAGKQLGREDQRDLFPEALRLVREIRPRGVMLENVPGFAEAKFSGYRGELQRELSSMGYSSEWRILQSSDFDVPQLRPRFVLVALMPADMDCFQWPEGTRTPRTVGETLAGVMGSRGWRGTGEWTEKANRIAPTVVGGSKLHGGPDLGPTRAKRQWRELHVDGMGIANAPPEAMAPRDLMPRLTVGMVALLQSFPEDWRFSGGKTAQYRQVGNAFPPKVACAVASSIRRAWSGGAWSPEFGYFQFESRLCDAPRNLIEGKASRRRPTQRALP